MKIFIDVGHGETGADTGAIGYASDGKTEVCENEQNLRIALAAREALEIGGHKVTLSREKNENITRPIGKYSQADSNLIASANKIKGGDYDIMISIHNNSSDNEEARGYQLYYKTGDGKESESKRLAESIGKALNGVTVCNMIGTRLGGSDNDYYGILRLHDKVGVLCECAFLSNEKDTEFLYENAENIGKAIAEGILEYGGSLRSEVSAACDYKQLYEKLREKVETVKQIFSEI